MGNHTHDDTAAIMAAARDAAAVGGVVLFGPGTYRVASDLSVNIPMILLPGAMLRPDNGVTIVIQAPLQAPTQRIFTNALPGKGTVKFQYDQEVPFTVYPDWWGAIGNGDDKRAELSYCSNRWPVMPTPSGDWRRTPPSEGSGNPGMPSALFL